MRILVVEDEHKIANSIKQGLEQEKYAVDVVYNGREGLDFSLSEEYDCIILDRMLPEVEGLEITKKVREANIHTPILILTAKSQLEDKVEGLDTGADDYLIKPFAFSELLARVRALVRRPKSSTGNILKVEDLSLDTTSYKVRRNNKTIKLSNKEFSLLVYLMRHAHQIMNKEQIINHVWDYNADVLPNSVEVYIKHLRDKIDRSEFKTKLIHTVRGFGYKLGK